MKKLCALLLAGALAFSLAACGNTTSSEVTSQPASAPLEQTDAPAAGTLTLTHDLGTTEISVNPEKIVVFDLGILDILDAVGIEVGGVPSANFPSYLAHYDTAALAWAGGMKEVDFEALNEYAPDLVILTGRTSDAYEECAAIAPTLYMNMPGATYMETMRENVEILAQIFPDKADDMLALLAEIDTAASALQQQAAATGLTALVAMANDGSLSFFSTGSRYGVIHDDYGFTEAATDVENSTHGDEGSFEYIAEVNPDVLFVIDRSAAIGTEGATGAAALLNNDFVNSTTAAQEGRIIYLSSDIWYLVSGGFSSTSAMIAEVAAALQ